MENPKIKIAEETSDPNKTTTDHSHTTTFTNSTFLLHNGLSHSSSIKISDIEMIAIKSITYTSLKDLLPSSPTSMIMSPTQNSSFYEIPIKNPLVKHAALAYLQPMSTPPNFGEVGFWGRLRGKLCGRRQGDSCGGCFEWLSGAVLNCLRETFWWERVKGEMRIIDDEEEEEEDEDEDDDDDDDREEKVTETGNCLL